MHKPSTVYCIGVLLVLQFFFAPCLSAIYSTCNPCPLDPPATSCSQNCQTCGIQNSTCSCYTDCQTATDYSQISCPANFLPYQDPATNSSGYDCSSGRLSRLCQTTTSTSNGICQKCFPYYFGSSCSACPGLVLGSNGVAIGACSGAGTCSEGTTGTGACTCNATFAGSACQYSRNATCNGKGAPQSDGSCVCDALYSGATCNTCAAGLYNYPQCKRCDPVLDCSSKGVCNTLGQCQCYSGYTGSTCSSCSTDYYNVNGQCTFCSASATCNNRGSCSSSAACICNSPFTGTNCLDCRPGYFGASCSQCPGPTSDPCNEGFCSDGASGTGVCTCPSGYSGVACRDPTIVDVTPVTGFIGGGTLVTVTGNSFGSANGTVQTTNAVNSTAALFSWSDKQVVFITPAGLAYSSSFRLFPANSSVGSTARSFTYLPPAITAISPNPVPAAGGWVTVIGELWAGTLSVSVQGVTVPTLNLGRPVIFNAPPGLTTNNQLLLRNGNNESVSFTFDYAPPQIFSVTPKPLSPMGGDVTLFGANFGTNALGSLTLSAAAILVSPTLRNDSHIIFRLSNGRLTAGELPILVTVQGRLVSINVPYAAPIITGLVGCTSSGPNAVNCPVDNTASMVLTINGDNFGPSTGLRFGRVTYESGNQLYTAGNTGGLVMLPPGYGLEQPLSVFDLQYRTVVSNTVLVSFVGPAIRQGTLTLCTGSPSGSPSIVNRTNTQSFRMCFCVSNYRYASTVSSVNVTFGPPEAPNRFTCAVSRFYNVDTANLNGCVECLAQSAVGTGLRVSVNILAPDSATTTSLNYQSLPSNDTLSYPAPILTPSSLQLGTTGTKSSTVTADSTNSMEVIMTGANFGNDTSLMTVTFGPDSDPNRYTCTVMSDSRDDYIRCITPPGGDGLNNRFTVSIGPSRSSRQSVRGTDVFNYPTAPVVFRVSGCTDKPAFNSTANCPTSGLLPNNTRVVLTVVGQYFTSSGATIRIGSNGPLDLCTHDSQTPAEKIYCPLAAGIGTDVPITISKGRFISRSATLLSYGQPVITSFRGCTGEGNVTRSCPINGGSSLFIVGSNFGASGLQVLVGQRSCIDVRQDSVMPHQKVTCTLPAQSTSASSVIVTVQQALGLASNPDTSPRLEYTICRAGTLLNLTALGCSPCTPGRFTDQDSMTECMPCLPGQATEQSGASQCQLCQPGAISSSEGQVQCAPCAAGTYAGSVGLTACDQCPIGSFSASPGSGGCSLCPIGRFSNLTATVACDPCPAGSFGASEGRTSCADCGAGRFSPSTGFGSCTPCQQGTSTNALSRQTSCMACAPGTYTDQTSAAVCSPCPPGFRQTGSGSTSCSPCDIGTFNAVFGAADCTPCARGFFTGQMGAVACSRCDAGFATNDTGSTGCQPCPIGWASTTAGSALCTQCPPGSITRTPGSDSCLPCPEGSFSTTFESTACTRCPMGTSAPTLGSTSCTPCAAGRYVASEGSEACLPCPPGTFTNLTGVTACDICAAGYAASQDGSTSCDACQPGYASERTTSQYCISCEPGKYALGNASTTCLECSPGQFLDAQAGTTCSRCQPGFYAASPGSILCSTCPAGTFTNTSGAANCQFCSAGRFSIAPVSSGPTACSDCLAGRFSGLGQASCEDCPQGTVTPANGMEACLSCPAGTFQQATGKTVCEKCAAGSANPLNGRAQCEACTPGRYQNSIGAADCVDCELGTQQSLGNATSCEVCMAGRYADARGLEDCLSCPPGSFSESSGAETCKLCPAGTAQRLAEQTACLDCSPGRSMPFRGQTSCYPCSPGFAASIFGSIDCAACPQGSAQPQAASLMCELCRPGRAASSNSSVACLDCPAGTFSRLNASTECTLCNAGYYQDQSSQTTCLLTPRGFFSLAGATSPSKCVINTVASEPGRSICEPCKNGEADALGVSCVCASGFYQTPNSTICVQCPVGADCAAPGMTFDRLSAAPGWWRPSDNSLEFQRCLQSLACTGGRGENICGAYRNGPLCAVCVEGYHLGFGNKDCVPCSSNESQRWGTRIGLSLAFVILVLLLMYVVLRADRALETAAVSFEGQSPARAPLADADDPSAPNSLPVITSEIRTEPSYVLRLKILATFLQLASQLVASTDMSWPALYVMVMNGLYIINMDIMPALDLGCGSVFYDKYVLTPIAPFVAIAFSWVVVYLPLRLLEYRRTRINPDDAKPEARYKYWKLVLFALSLLYANTSSTIMSLFICKEVNGKSYLMTDMSVECYDARWYKHAYFGAAMIALWPLGIPTLFFVLLWRNRHRLAELDTRLRMGFLYQPYDKGVWWFDSVDMLHKLIIASLFKLLPSPYHMWAAMIATVAYMMIILVSRPYLRKDNERYMMVAQVELLLLILASYILDGQQGAPLDRKTDVLISIVLLAMTIGFVFSGAWMGIAALLNKLWPNLLPEWMGGESRVNNKQKMMQAAGQVSGPYFVTKGLQDDERTLVIESSRPQPQQPQPQPQQQEQGLQLTRLDSGRAELITSSDTSSSAL